MAYDIILSKKAVKQVENFKGQTQLSKKVQELLNVLKVDPYQNPPRYEKLVGKLKGLYSRRIDRQHRLVYEVLEDKEIVHVLSMWTHYE